MTHQNEWSSAAAALRKMSESFSEPELIRAIEICARAWEREGTRPPSAVPSFPLISDRAPSPTPPTEVYSAPTSKSSDVASFTDRHTRPERIEPRSEDRPRDLPPARPTRQREAPPTAKRQIASFDDRYSRAASNQGPNLAEERRTALRNRTPADPVASKREREEGQTRFRTQNQPAPEPSPLEKPPALPSPDPSREAAREALEARAAAAEAEARAAAERKVSDTPDTKTDDMPETDRPEKKDG